MIHTIAGIAAGALTLGQWFPYITSVLRGQTTPNRVSFGIWATVDTILITSYIMSGARTTIWAGIVSTIEDVVVFLLALKHGEGGYSRFDLGCLGMALAALAVWLSTDNPALAVYLTTFVITVVFFPTFKKVYERPGSENKIAWTMFAAGCLLNVGALTSLRPDVAVLPLALVPSSLVMVVLLFRRHNRTLNTSTDEASRVNTSRRNPNEDQ